MSFILDALRKSEHERHRQSGPGLAETAIAPPRARTNPWATAAIVLLVVNLLAIGVLLLLRSGDEAAGGSSEQPTAAAIPAPGSPAAPAGDVAPAPRASVTRTLPAATPRAAPPPPMLRPAAAPPPAGRNPLEGEVSERAPATEPAESARAALPPPGPPAVVAAPSRGGSVVYQDLPEANAAVTGPVTRSEPDLPTADEVAPAMGLPDLRLELHVYSNRPQERFVFINSTRYREGETTPEGATIEQITVDGVVMNAQGRRFLLPRD